MGKTKVLLNKPIYVGMAVLDLSKTLMYTFHYGYIKPMYRDRAKLLFTDTNSLMYEIKTENFYKDISPDVHNQFDTSNYSPDHPSGIPTGINKKVIGLFKDEAGGQLIIEFVGLRAKLYTFKTEKGFEIKKCKRIKKAVIKNDITFNDYLECLKNSRPMMRKMNVIRSNKHEVYTETVNKVALSHEDDKRFILEDGIKTLEHGHYLLRTSTGGNSVSSGTT